MGSKNRYSKSRAKKRRFQESKNDSLDNSNALQQTVLSEHRPINVGGSASAKKIDLSLLENVDEIEKECNIIMNSNLFSILLKTIGRCPECCTTINIVLDINKKEGLSHTFLISCQDCTWKINFVTSKSIENKDKTIQGKKMKEINLRTVLAF